MIVNADSLIAPIASGIADLIVTSPPYYNAREVYSRWSSYNLYLDDMHLALRECFRISKDGGRIAWNVPHGYDRPGNGGYKPIGEQMTRLIQNVGYELRGHIIWSKSGFSPQATSTAWGSWMEASNPSLRDDHEIIIVAHKGNPKLEPVGESTIDRETFLAATRSVWEIMPVSNHPWHPASFPVEIPRRLIELYTYKGGVVVDPFCGSGTTVRVAAELGRVGVGIERKFEYARLAYMDVRLSKWDWDESHIQWLLLKKKLERQKELLAGGNLGISDLPLWVQGEEDA